MNNHWLERTELLIKQQGINTLQKAHILIVGLGGVGSFAAEFIARAGVGALTIVDGDCVSLSNIKLFSLELIKYEVIYKISL